MINITVKDNSKEAFEKAMKIFKKRVQDDGFIVEIHERKYYKKPSQKRHEKMLKLKREREKEEKKRLKGKK